MKSTIKLYPIVAIAGLLFFTQCSGEETDKSENAADMGGSEQVDVAPVENIEPETVEDSYNEVVFDVAEVDAVYPGGELSMADFIVDNVVYPEAAFEAGTEGTVYINFVVSSKGEIKNAKVEQGVDKILDDEALRVVNAMPNWEPGQSDNGEKIAVRYTLPIKFKLN